MSLGPKHVLPFSSFLNHIINGINNGNKILRFYNTLNSSKLLQNLSEAAPIPLTGLEGLAIIPPSATSINFLTYILAHSFLLGSLIPLYPLLSNLIAQNQDQSLNFLSFLTG